MEFETKIISRQIGDMLYASGLSLGTAESCTGGLISEAIIATPGASNYFKGSVVSYTNEIKERLLTYGNREEIRTQKLTDDFGRDINIAIATNKAMRLMHHFLEEKLPQDLPESIESRW